MRWKVRDQTSKLQKRSKGVSDGSRQLLRAEVECKPVFSGHLYTHEFDYVGQPDSMKMRLRGAKMVESKISSNFDSKFDLKAIFRDFEIFADLRVI